MNEIVSDYKENYQSGWIKIYRSIQNKAYYKNSKYVHLWVHLLLKANHKENEWLYRNEINKIKPGQFITSRITLSNETGIKQTTVENILNLLESEHQIGQQKYATKRVITILNWESYQLNGQQNGPGSDNKVTTNGQQIDTNKKEKKEKNVKNVSIADREKEFYEEIKKCKPNDPEIIYTKEMKRAFFDYWSEQSKDGKCMRFEKEKTWQTSKRLATWYRRS